MFVSLQSVCDWENRETMFHEVEDIIKRQIKVPLFDKFHFVK
jgi:protein O-GlcNAc transferase